MFARLMYSGGLTPKALTSVIIYFATSFESPIDSISNMGPIGADEFSFAAFLYLLMVINQ